MKTVDKIIFDELAGRRSVILPGVGTLGVERRAAVLKNSRTLESPFNIVTFSRREIASVRSVVDLLVAGGMEPEAAGKIYGEWLGRARVGATVHVEGAGTLEAGFFKVAGPLGDLLNPGFEKVIRLKPLHRFRALRIGGLLLLCLLIAGAGGYYWYIDYYGMTSGPDREETAQIPVPAAPVAGRTVQLDSAATDTPPLDTLPAEKRAAALDSAGEKVPAATSGTVSGYMYYVVGGVYSTEENADRAIAGFKRADAAVVCEKVPFAGGKIMISLYSSGDESQVARERAGLSARLNNLDLWVYKKKINK